MLIRLMDIVNLLSPLRVQLIHTSLTVTYTVVLTFYLSHAEHAVLSTREWCVLVHKRERETQNLYSRAVMPISGEVSSDRVSYSESADERLSDKRS